MTRSRPARGLALVALLTMVACSGGGEDSGRPASANPKSAPSTRTQSEAPLTGLPLEPSRAGRPLLVVKIDNAPRARPQVGLGEADVVVEEAVEGGVTRFAALFHSRDADPVGPVRSARSTDIFIASALNRPLFAYSGANAAFQSLIARAPLVDVGVDRFPNDYPRRRDRPAPHNQFSSTPALLAHGPAGAGPPPRLFSFRAQGEHTSAAGASPAAGVSINFPGRVPTSVQYRWDGVSGVWKRSHGPAPHVDDMGRQFAPRNVVVQLVNYRSTGLRDTSGADVPEAELVGQGEVWVFTDGKVVKGRWRKASAEAVTEYLDSSGAPVRLTPGQTWVELPVPGRATVDP